MRPSPMQLMNHREFPVLYVDDEPQNLRIFEITFQRDFDVLTAESAAEGMRLLNENPIAVVLSDHKMPEMTGTEFLARVRELDDRTVRILVTAYGNAETLGSAINDGSIYRYVPKPWEPEEMRVTLRRAIEAYALDRERDALIHELTMVNRLSRLMHRETDPDRLIGVLLDAAHKQLGFDAVALLFFDDRDRVLEWAGLEPNDGEVANTVRQIEISVDTASNFIHQLRKGHPQELRVENLSELEPPIREWVAEVSAEEILVVPLLGKDKVIGAMAIDNRSGGRRFGADDRTLLDGLAVQAVIAIQNASLIDDLKNSRRRVEHADLLGTLAAGLSQEIDDPRCPIRTFLSLAPERRSSDDAASWAEHRALACSEVERVSGLAAILSRLANGGREIPLPEPVDACELAREVATRMDPEFKAAGVELEIDLDDETPKLSAIRIQLQQVIMNLLTNALQAAPQGTGVRLAVMPSPAGTQEGVGISVTDHGPGIAEGDLEQIFDPFFAPSGPDPETGLGLVISHRIVADHRGEIEVRSRIGEGATFQVTLPCAGAAAAPGKTGPG